jgi:hypothetical protein
MSFRSVFIAVVRGAPPFAPLLFPNLVLLGLIALYALGKHLPEEDATPEQQHTAASD